MSQKREPSKAAPPLDTDDTSLTAVSSSQFLAAVTALCQDFGWQPHAFPCTEEFVVGVSLDDEPFAQILWILDTRSLSLRLLVMLRPEISDIFQPAILEWCARVNDGLTFGCAEFCFDEHIVIFRDSADLRRQALETAITDVTARLFQLAQHYGPGVRMVCAGTPARQAIAQLETHLL